MMNEFNYNESGMIRRWVNFINWRLCYFLFNENRPERRPQSICTLFWTSVWSVLMLLTNALAVIGMGICTLLIVFLFGTLLFSPLSNAIFGFYWELPDSNITFFVMSIISMILWSGIGVLAFMIGRHVAEEDKQLERSTDGDIPRAWWAKDVFVRERSSNREPSLIGEFLRSRKEKICPRITYN